MMHVFKNLKILYISFISLNKCQVYPPSFPQEKELEGMPLGKAFARKENDVCVCVHTCTHVHVCACAHAICVFL